MKILIIGKGGQLADALEHHAAKRNIEYVSLGMTDLDITNRDAVKPTIEKHAPDVVINAAAYNAVPKLETEPEAGFAVNTFAVHHMAKVCRELGVRFVSYSTDYVFDGLSGEPILEDAPVSPRQMYGVSKAAGEFAVMNENDDALMIRTCGVYGGLTGSPVKGNFVLTMLQLAKEKKPITVAGNHFAAPTYAEDLAESSLELLEKNAKGGLYHLVNEGYCSWAEFAQYIFEKRGLTVDLTVEDIVEKEGDMKRPVFAVLKNTHAAEYGVVLRSWQEAVSAYLETLPVENE